MNYLISDAFCETRKIDNWSKFWFVLGDFLDDFKRDPNPERLKEEPNYSQPIMSAFLAAVVDQLSYENNLPTPEWTYNRKYYLSEPFFSGGFKGVYNICLLQETPLAFKVRNIFASANVLSRC